MVESSFADDVTQKCVRMNWSFVLRRFTFCMVEPSCAGDVTEILFVIIWSFGLSDVVFAWLTHRMQVTSRRDVSKSYDPSRESHVEFAPLTHRMQVMSRIVFFKII